MILDYYRIFYYVAQYKSFSKAADVMGNNQPNITRCMNILENDLGCKLFIRSNRGVQLTIEGERLFEHVSIAIEQLVSGENELLKDKGLESGLVNIGASEIALRLFLLNELEVFHHHYPHFQSFHTAGSPGSGKRTGRLRSSHYSCCAEEASTESSSVFFPGDSYRRRGICRNCLQKTPSAGLAGYPPDRNRTGHQYKGIIYAVLHAP
jgi:hypothetical protein